MFEWGIFMDNSIKVLVTGANAPGFHSIVKCLTDSGYEIYGSDYKIPENIKNFLNNKYFISPSITVDSSNRELKEYAEFVINQAKVIKANVILPIRTADMMAFAMKQPNFDNEIAIAAATPNRDYIREINDKYSLLCCADLKGGSVCNFLSFDDMDELIEKLSVIKTHEFVIKPRMQTGSRGMRIIMRRGSRGILREQFLSEKPESCLRMDMIQLKYLLGKEKVSMMAMDYLPGSEYTIDCLCYRGETYGIFPRLRIETKGGISTTAKVVKDNNFEIMNKTCETLIRRYELSYNIGFQFKCDEAGVPRLIECNPRLQGSTCVTAAAGVNIPDIVVKMVLKKTNFLTDLKHFDVKWDITMYRRWEEDYI